MKLHRTPQRLKRSTRGEMLVETLAATLIAMLAIVMLFTAAGTAAKINSDANTRASDLQSEQERAALQSGSGVQGSVVFESSGAQIRVPARFYGGKDFSSYLLQVKGGTAFASSKADTVFYNTRPVSAKEQAVFSAWPQDQGPLCWYRASEQGHEYFVARPARLEGSLCLVYYGGVYYKCVAEADDADLVAEAGGFKIAQLDGAADSGRRWMAVSVL